MDYRIQGKNAFINAGAHGIGEAIASFSPRRAQGLSWPTAPKRR